MYGDIGIGTQYTTTYATNTNNQRADRNDFGTDAFFRLLTTQLRYQNPFESMDNQQLMAQVAQFSILEELQKIRAQLTELTALSMAQSWQRTGESNG